MESGVEFDLIAKIDIPAKDLQLEVIQEVLHRARHTRNEDTTHSWNKILQILWDHLQTGLTKSDDQLLCGVCFFTVLELTQEKQSYFEKVLILINEHIALKDKFNKNKDQYLVNDMNTDQVVALMYGLLQSKCVLLICCEEVPIILDILKSSLDLLIRMGYEYSRHTFIVFKILSSFKILSGSNLEKLLFCTDQNYLVTLLNLVNRNWENPITGVRDLNKIIFQNILVMCTEDYLKVVLANIDSFSYWNKAKYLMIAGMIDQEYNFAAPNHWIKEQNHWIDGLMCSLSKPGLVSAGADMYYSILKKVSTEDEWCDLFLNRIIQVLLGTCTKAIENFSNYWCLTTFKKFPSLTKILIGELENVNQSDGNLYSNLCVLKQANKLGLVSKLWSNEHYSFVENKVLDGIEHSDAQIRMLAFEILAVTVGKVMPTPVEYKLILEYLRNNVNSDSTVLRISMLGNIKYFLTHLCASYIDLKKHNQVVESDNLETFYKNLQYFIIDSFDFDGNYQRKITTIKLCHTFLSSLNETSKKRQKQTTTSGAAMIKMLIEKDCLFLLNDDFLLILIRLLKDPSDDIRDSIVQLLLEHYCSKITAPLINDLIEDAQKCIRSKFFYQISCGQSMFRLISSLLLKCEFKDTVFKSIDDVFNYAYLVLNSDNDLRRDIVSSIENGKQLHAYINVLQEVLKVSKQFSCEIKILRRERARILNILEMVSDQFAWEAEPEVSSDFSKMSDVVQDIITSSGFNPLDEKDSAKISGLQQVVLNCLWLNVKASCDLASTLITFMEDDSEAEACEQCLAIITHVLETSRHKGAIEAAGAALGRAIHHLTSLGSGAGAGLPRRLLRRKMASLRARAGASVTRRGAGLSIMLHRVVAGDAAKGKPLFHYFMETLLQTCNEDQDIPATLDEGQRDVPKAVFIHFLTRIVTDSSLASDMMFYSADLAEVAFGNLTSPHWQIRNAALQLYGALVPKLIGQKKASGTDSESVGTVAIDEFRTHSPRLWQHMIKCLRELDETNPVESHSNALPIVNVLANLAKRYDFDGASFPDSTELWNCLLVLLGSPILTVRRLTAKCIYNIYSYEVLDIISDKIVNNQLRGENLLHGCLLVIQHYHKHNREQVRPIIEQLTHYMRQGNHSYVSRIEFEYLDKYDASNITEVLAEVKRNRYSPGVQHWANNRLEKYVRNCFWDEIPNICKIFLEQSDYERYCTFIFEKLKSGCNIPHDILSEIGVTMLEFKNKFDSCIIWKILYHISLQVKCCIIDVTNMFEKLQQEVPYKTRYLIPFLASQGESIPTHCLSKLSDTIFSLCDPDKSDVDMRHIAALANNEIANIFPKIPDTIRISAIKCAVLLLQDEDEDVRATNIQFYTNIVKDDSILQPFVCLTKIMNTTFLESCLDNPHHGIPAFCMDLTDILVHYAKSDEIDEYNPFSNDSKNIYFEPEVVKKFVQNL